MAVADAVADGDIATMLGTGNFAAGAALGFDTASGDRTYSVALVDGVGGALGLTKLGANTLFLSGANTYSGGTTIDGGILQFNTKSAIPTTPATGGITINTGGALGRCRGPNHGHGLAQ